MDAHKRKISACISGRFTSNRIIFTKFHFSSLTSVLQKIYGIAKFYKFLLNSCIKINKTIVLSLSLRCYRKFKQFTVFSPNSKRISYFVYNNRGNKSTFATSIDATDIWNYSVSKTRSYKIGIRK